MVRRTILTGLIVGVCGIMTYVFADEPPPKQEKEKSELAKLMRKHIGHHAAYANDQTC